VTKIGSVFIRALCLTSLKSPIKMHGRRCTARLVVNFEFGGMNPKGREQISCKDKKVTGPNFAASIRPFTLPMLPDSILILLPLKVFRLRH